MKNLNNHNLRIIPLRKVEGILVDIDNTLYSYEIAHNEAINACYDLFQKEGINDMSREDFRGIYRKKRNEVTERLQPQGACRSRLFAFQSFFEEYSLPQTYSLALEFHSFYWNNFINNMHPSEEIINFLKDCKKLGKSICAVSDMQADIQIQKLEKLELLQIIDFLVTSEEVGFEKPNKKIFDMALKKLNLPKEKVIMIGDNLQKDVESAEKYGLKGYRFEA